MERFKLNKTQRVVIDGISYLFTIGNSHYSYAGSYPRKVKRRIRQIWLQYAGQYQYIKKYNWCKRNGLDFIIEFSNTDFVKI